MKIYLKNMKKLFTLLALIVITTINAQAPQGFNYQATVRNSSGALIINQNVLFKFNIMLNSQTSLPVYSETHQAPTDDLGQVNLTIGSGTPTTGTFSSINWGNGSYFLGIELNTGAGYVAMGTTQLLSVPYALYANTAGSTSSNNTGLISPTITTNPVANIIGTTATFSASISNVNINQLSRAGFVYSLNPNPIYEFASGGTSPGNALEVNLSSNTFTFDSAVQGFPNFSPNTLYYVRAFVITENNTIVYGNEISFVTEEASSSQQTIVDIASANANLSILVQALDKVGLVATLQGAGPFTVFAPDNDAFIAAGYTSAVISALPANDPGLTQILLNHVVIGAVQSTGLTNNTYIKTLGKGSASSINTLSMYVKIAGATVTLNGGATNSGATIVTADIEASNGVIHVVDNVISLPTVVNHAIANPNFTTLFGSLSGAGLLPTLSGTAGSPFTVFAPTNGAFTTFESQNPGVLASLSSGQLSSVLTYHVVGANVLSIAIPTSPITTLESGTFTIAGTTITDEQNRQTSIILTDVQCSNGVIHAVNNVLLPSL
jgi:uncharacterized surface protein with fasciclin (FAS1) repeats